MHAVVKSVAMWLNSRQGRTNATNTYILIHPPTCLPTYLPPCSPNQPCQGWIPAAIVNFCAEAIPLNIHRIRRMLQRMPPEVVERLVGRSRAQVGGRRRVYCARL